MYFVILEGKNGMIKKQSKMRKKTPRIGGKIAQNKIMDLNSDISAFILNVNLLNSPVKT